MGPNGARAADSVRILSRRQRVIKLTSSFFPYHTYAAAVDIYIYFLHPSFRHAMQKAHVASNNAAECVKMMGDGRVVMCRSDDDVERRR